MHLQWCTHARVCTGTLESAVSFCEIKSKVKILQQVGSAKCVYASTVHVPSDQFIRTSFVYLMVTVILHLAKSTMTMIKPFMIETGVGVGTRDNAGTGTVRHFHGIMHRRVWLLLLLDACGCCVWLLWYMLHARCLLQS